MKVKLHHLFEKSYKNRITPTKKLISQTEERIALFKTDPKNSLLKDHGLTGAKKRLRAFSVTGDILIVYLPISDTEVIFIDFSFGRPFHEGLDLQIILRFI